MRRRCETDTMLIFMPTTMSHQAARPAPLRRTLRWQP
jgi:hypothetical protein